MDLSKKMGYTHIFMAVFIGKLMIHHQSRETLFSDKPISQMGYDQVAAWDMTGWNIAMKKNRGVQLPERRETVFYS